MAITLSLSADKRTLTGRKVKSLRNKDFLPANVYGKNLKSQSLKLPLSEFKSVFFKAGETNLVSLKVKGESKPRPVLITNVHFHPVTQIPLHADFHQVDLKEKVTAEIPVELVGEAPAVKEKDAVLFQVHNEIEVEALPTDLIDKIEVDVTKLTDIGASILAKDLKVNRSKLTLQIDNEEPIVLIQEKKEEKEVSTPPAEEEVLEGEAPTEGEAPAEGEEAKPEDKPVSPAGGSKDKVQGKKPEAKPVSPAGGPKTKQGGKDKKS